MVGSRGRHKDDEDWAFSAGAQRLMRTLGKGLGFCYSDTNVINEGIP